MITSVENVRGALPKLILQHVENAIDLVAALADFPFSRRLLSDCQAFHERLNANMDALYVAGNHAKEIGQAAIGNAGSYSWYGVLTMLLIECGFKLGKDDKDLLTLSPNRSVEERRGVWCGLRYSKPMKVEPHVKNLFKHAKSGYQSAAALDILAFHRLPVHAEIGELPDEEEVACLLAEAGGRMRGAWKTRHLKKFLGHGSPRVREVALRASARSGIPELPAFCREATIKSAPLEAIGFLGVVGTEEDLSRLQRTAESATDPATAAAALNALGRLGLPASMPVLLEFLDHADLAEGAAAGIERITGQRVPRGTFPDPSPDLTEDELDLWEPKPPLDVSRARNWWKSNAAHFDSTKRYQVGLCVSDNPLGPVFDQLPLAIRYDVYLRERALTPGTPDWELETWTWKQKNPIG